MELANSLRRPGPLPTRRALLWLVPALALRPAPSRAATATFRLAALEASSGGRLGLAGVNTGTGAALMYRADERFAFCSTFKMLLAAAILQRAAISPALLSERLTYTQADLRSHSPVSEQHLHGGMSVQEACAAVIEYSDNTAANVLTRLLGGPAGVTAFARALGDTEFRLDRYETAMSDATPDDPRDTTTPAAMLATLRRITLGDALPPPARAQLLAWMRGNTVGAARIRAGVPAGWDVADKTGTGGYGTVNDIGLITPPGRPPNALTLYFTIGKPDAPLREDILAAATKVAMDVLA